MEFSLLGVSDYFLKSYPALTDAHSEWTHEVTCHHCCPAGCGDCAAVPGGCGGAGGSSRRASCSGSPQKARRLRAGAIGSAAASFTVQAC